MTEMTNGFRQRATQADRVIARFEHDRKRAAHTIDYPRRTDTQSIARHQDLVRRRERNSRVERLLRNVLQIADDGCGRLRAAGWRLQVETAVLFR